MHGKLGALLTRRTERPIPSGYFENGFRHS